MAFLKLALLALAVGARAADEGGGLHLGAWSVSGRRLDEWRDLHSDPGRPEYAQD